MGQNSKIEWCHHTLNPWIGCAKVSAGCKHCYAEHLMDHRHGKVVWGPNGTRVRTSPGNWKKPLQWNANRWHCPECGKWAKAGGVCGGRNPISNGLMFKPGSNIITEAPQWESCKGERVFIERPRVFCASLADVFEDRPDLVDWRMDLFALIDATPNLDWLLLTKRPEKVMDLWPWNSTGGCAHDEVEMQMRRPNVWLGTSVEDQAAADTRIPQLLAAASLARFTFLSCEPLLGPVDLQLQGRNLGIVSKGEEVNWVIVGGESGTGARPMHPAWARRIVADCKAAGVPVLFKQWGEYGKPGIPVMLNTHEKGVVVNLDGTLYPGSTSSAPKGSIAMRKVGKHAAGRLLDGVEHNGYPA